MDERYLTDRAALLAELRAELPATRPQAPDDDPWDIPLSDVVAPLNVPLPEPTEAPAMTSNVISLPTPTLRPASAPETVTDDWRHRARCAGAAGKFDATQPDDAVDALAECAKCPVIAQCRAEFDNDPDYAGVAGGRVYCITRRGNKTVQIVWDPSEETTEVAA